MTHRTVSCGTCGGRAENPTGIYLERIAEGRTICAGCGRFQVHCTCRPVSEIRRETARERKREQRDRLRARGLTAAGTAPVGRRMISWARGQHVVEPNPETRRCRNCLRKIRPVRDAKGWTGWRHA